MSTERIFGSWNSPTTQAAHDGLASLWHKLAAQNLGNPEFKPNFGLSQRKSEIIMLWTLYRRAMPEVVLEIGVAQGGTFASWCHLGKSDAIIIGIDRDVNDCRPRQGEPVNSDIGNNSNLRLTTQGGGMYALAKDNQRIHPISGWSHEPHVMEQLLMHLAGRKIDWLFHDASHSASMFAKDFSIYWPLVAEGGVFAAHDIMPSAHPDCDKSVEWERIKREEDYSACMEFRGSRTDDSLGIGLLIK